MSSIMSSARPSSTACSNLYDTPVNDAVCAMPYSKNNAKMMSDCCKGTGVVSYYNNCGLYCLAVGQSVEELTKCIYDKGAEWEDVFCRGNISATATATGTSVEIAASASASVISVSKDDDKDDKKDDKDDNKDDKSESDKKDDAKNNGGRLACPTTLGLATAGLLLSTFLFGTL